MLYLPDKPDMFSHVCIFFASLCIGRYVAHLASVKPLDVVMQYCRGCYRMIQKYLGIYFYPTKIFNGAYSKTYINTTENKGRWTLTSEHIDMIAMRKWKDLLVWIVFHPDELLYVDKRNQTVLHHACLFRAPAQIIRMLLFQKPELAKIQNIDMELPLHWAVRLSAPNEVIKLLLSVHPSSACSIKDKDGNTALSMVWERSESSLLESWWRSGQQSVLENNGWANILYYFQCYSYSLNVLHDDYSCWDDDENVHLARIEEHSKVFLPLHTATQCPSCPLMLYTLLLRVYKDQINIEDNHGRLPLAVACWNPISNRSIGVLTKVHLLLAEYPLAAQKMDCHGILPLFAALRSSLTWNEGIDRLIASYPRSLLLCDPVTSLPAFLSAATQSNATRNLFDVKVPTMSCEGQEHWDGAHLSTIYSLFRKDPAQINVTSRYLNK